jgi:ribosomal-protein-alanine N-acetyltransferase
VLTRLLTADDVPELTALLKANREFMGPWDPIREDSYYTEDGQRAVVEDLVARSWQGTGHPRVIVEDGRIIGRVNLSNIVRGPFQSANLGYFVDAGCNGRGLATAAVGETVRVAFDELGLHRIEAGTLTHNLGSQRVLERNGFQRYGLAPRYLSIDGDWRDHVLFQRLNE